MFFHIIGWDPLTYLWEASQGEEAGVGGGGFVEQLHEGDMGGGTRVVQQPGHLLGRGRGARLIDGKLPEQAGTPGDRQVVMLNE